MSDGSVYKKLLGAPRAGGLESAEGGSEDAEGGSEDAALDQDKLVKQLQEDIGYLEDRLGEHADPDALARLLSEAKHGLQEVADHGAEARLERQDLAGLEAVVHSDGSRPVLFVEDDFIDVLAPAAKNHNAALSRVEGEVRIACQAVGRVNDPSSSLGYQGTAWAIGEGIVVTNYHVLAAIATHASRTNRGFTGALKPGITVDFGAEVGGGPADRRFPVRHVRAVGRPGRPEHAHPTLREINFDGLDLAVLELSEVRGQSFPTPVKVARGDDPATRGALASRGRSVYVVGFPGNPKSTTPDVFGTLFAGVKGVKRLTPGRLTQGRGEVDGDSRRWIIGHDASTLGGSSGSLIVDLEAEGRLVLGLHFAGLPERVNWAHSLEGATAELAVAVPGW